jgi:hypothetical protein
MADLYETIIGIVYEKFNHDSFKISCFMNDIQFNLYSRRGVDNRAEKLLRISAKAFSRGDELKSFPERVEIKRRTGSYKVYEFSVPSVLEVPGLDASYRASLKLKDIRNIVVRHKCYGNVETKVSEPKPVHTRIQQVLDLVETSTFSSKEPDISSKTKDRSVHLPGSHFQSGEARLMTLEALEVANKDRFARVNESERRAIHALSPLRAKVLRWSSSLRVVVTDAQNWDEPPDPEVVSKIYRRGAMGFLRT